MSLLPLRRRRKRAFEHAADGSMTLMEHLRELRVRLVRASLAVLVGFGAAYWLSDDVIKLVKKPVCDVMLPRYGECAFVQLGPADYFLLTLKVGLWLGLIIAAPIWLYQLWAFVAPGLHRHERRYAYIFVAIAAPLFAAGAVLAFFALKHGLEFLLPPKDVVATQLDITRYVNFLTTMMIVFGVAFEFPLIALMLNLTGLLSGRRMLSWWRVTVFAFFAFAAVATPTPDPFTMSGLAGAMSLLYFGAVGVALVNDRRRARAQPMYAGVADDETSPLDYDHRPLGEVDPIEPVEPVAAAEPLPAVDPVPGPRSLDPRYDDMT